MRWRWRWRFLALALAICECPFWRFFFSFWRFGALAILAKKKKAVEEYFKPSSVGSHPNKRNGVQEEVMCKVGFGCAASHQKTQRMLFIRELDRKLKKADPGFRHLSPPRRTGSSFIMHTSMRHGPCKNPIDRRLFGQSTPHRHGENSSQHRNSGTDLSHASLLGELCANFG